MPLKTEMSERRKLMDIRDWLKQIREFDMMIQDKKERIKELWCKATYPGVSYDIRVQSSKNFNKQTDIIGKIIELEQEIDMLTIELNRRQKQVQEESEKLENKDMAKVLVDRYINMKPWNIIAKELDCTTRWAIELHNRAIKKMSKTFVVHY